jgi:hypothetical protein
MAMNSPSRGLLAAAALAVLALLACDTTAARPVSTPAPSPTWRYSTDLSVRATFPDLAYATNSAQEKLDLYLPRKAATRAPLVIWIHGGRFSVGDKSSMPRRDFGPPPTPTGPMGPYQIQVPDVAALMARGYAVASLNYRLGAGPDAGTVLEATQDG